MKPTTREWMDIAEEDLDAARAMRDTGRYLYAAFQAQQCAEKALKAVLQEKLAAPPKVHDLETLAEKAGLVESDLSRRLRILSAYYIATRYPEDRARLRDVTDREKAVNLIGIAEEVLAWATGQLNSTRS